MSKKVEENQGAVKAEENQDTVMGTIWEAIEKDDVESLRKLVESGANLNDLKGEDSVLQYAALYDSVGSLKYLLESGYIDNPHYYYSQLLEYALGFPKMKVVKYLVEEKHASSNQSISIAVEKGELEAFKYLVEQGEPLSINGDNRSLKYVMCYWAPYQGEDKISTYLIDKMNPSECDSALCEVAKKGRADLVKYLVMKGVVGNLPYSEEYSPECLPLLKLALLLQDACLLRVKTDADTSILKELNEEELIICAKNIMTNSLIKYGIPNHYQARFEAYSKVLPDFLQKSLISCFNDLNTKSKEPLEVLEGAVRFHLENLSPVPYSEITKHDWAKITPEQQAVCKYYDEHPEYKTAGNYLAEIISSNSQLDIPVLRHLMLKHTDVAELAIQLDAHNILPIELKQKLHGITYKHTYSGYQAENKSLTTLIGQQEKIEEQKVMIEEEQEKIGLLETQLTKICSFLNTIGFEGSATDTGSAGVLPAIGETLCSISIFEHPTE